MIEHKRPRQQDLGGPKKDAEEKSTQGNRRNWELYCFLNPAELRAVGTCMLRAMRGEKGRWGKKCVRDSAGERSTQ